MAECSVLLLIKKSTISLSWLHFFAIRSFMVTVKHVSFVMVVFRNKSLLDGRGKKKLASVPRPTTRKSVVRIGALLLVRTSMTRERRCIIHLDWCNTTISKEVEQVWQPENRGGTGCVRGVGVTVPTVAVVLLQWPGLGTETHNISDTPGEWGHK